MSRTGAADALHASEGRFRTERKRAEAVLREAHAELARRVAEFQALERRMADRTAELEAFCYTVSHNLRTPLRAIEGFTRLLEAEHSGPLGEEGRRLLRVISTSTQTMGQLIDGLLAFSRLGRQEMSPTRIDMGELARSALDEIAAGRPASRLALTLRALPAACGDPTMLRQVFVNLLANALKFTSARDRAVIEIGAEPRDGETAYYVRDNGVGFDMAYADKLFGVFQRLHRPDEFEGTGVGLAIVKRIVERHGGRVWAQGKVGNGAMLFFALPEGGC